MVVVLIVCIGGGGRVAVMIANHFTKYTYCRYRYLVHLQRRMSDSCPFQHQRSITVHCCSVVATRQPSPPSMYSLDTCCTAGFSCGHSCPPAKFGARITEGPERFYLDLVISFIGQKWQQQANNNSTFLVAWTGGQKTDTVQFCWPPCSEFVFGYASTISYNFRFRLNLQWITSRKR